MCNSRCFTSLCFRALLIVITVAMSAGSQAQVADAEQKNNDGAPWHRATDEYNKRPSGARFASYYTISLADLKAQWKDEKLQTDIRIFNAISDDGKAIIVAKMTGDGRIDNTAPFLLMGASSLCPNNCDVDYNTGKAFLRIPSATVINGEAAKLATVAVSRISTDPINQVVVQKNVLNYFVTLSGCSAIRVYNGIDKGARVAIIVGVDAAGKNIASKFYYSESNNSLCPNNCDVF